MFQVGLNGRILHQSSGASPGAPALGAPPPDLAYVQAAGAEHAYYGRGYVQLTWWNNYASTGVEIGLGLELLFRPEPALDPAIAYEVMAHGMIHGSGFANGKRFQMYFLGSYTDYVGARHMVNGTNDAPAIAHVARIFEACLMRSKA